MSCLQTAFRTDSVSTQRHIFTIVKTTRTQFILKILYNHMKGRKSLLQIHTVKSLPEQDGLVKLTSVPN